MIYLRRILKVSKRTRKTKVIKPAIAIALVLAVAAGSFFGYRHFRGKSKNAMGGDVSGTDVVSRGDLEVAITGEASVEPYERYEIISMVSGDIIRSPYDVGDTVSEGAVLYQFDTSNAQTSIKKQELSLEQSRNSLNNAKSDLAEAQDKLVITAPNSGIISGMTIKKGSSVSNNENIAKIDNTQEMEVTLPFTKEQTSQIYIGQTAVLSSSAHMSSVSGNVESISSEAEAQADGSVVYNVKIGFTNPGSFTQGLTVGGEINGMQSPGYGTVECSESGNAKAESAGTVSNVYYSNGDFVTAGSTIAAISSDSLTSQKRSIESSELNLKNAQLAMQETKDSLDDYSIKSPISGTVITKNAKAGDTIDRTNSSTVLMVVADISRLKFSMEVDELDVSSVCEGQRVDITCDALSNEEFEGKITSISVEGTATNGVTTYTAEVVIDNPGNLRPSMNIDASVIVESAENVLIVPTSDIKTAMGISYVFLKDETGTRGAGEEEFMGAMRRNASENKEQEDMTISNEINTEKNHERKAPEGGMREGIGSPPSMEENAGERPENNVNDTEQGDEKNSKTKENSERDGGNAKSRLPEAPDGFVTAIVETGISDDENTEIKSGLSEGDLIQRLSTSSSENNSGMPGMGGMPGGGMPGMSGMPSGGMSGGGNRMSGGGGGMPGGR